METFHVPHPQINVHVAPSSLRSAIDLLNPKTAGVANFGQSVGNQWIQQQFAGIKKQPN